MKHFFIRAQLLIASALLLGTLFLTLALVKQHNFRWDGTSEKVYTIADETIQLLRRMEDKPLEVLAFYPHDDMARSGFETFLKQCRLFHSKFRYHFYDPDSVPSIAKKYNVKAFFTVVILYDGRRENLVGPSEEGFANALLRLANPKRFNLCFASGHGESGLADQERAGLSQFKAMLEAMDFGTHEIILLRDAVPEMCNVLVIAGPHQDFDPAEFGHLKKSFVKGTGILFLIDPMDPGAGRTYREFMQGFGIYLGEDVIVDKASRLEGGDFLVPLVNQYVTTHPITSRFNQPTFFPVSRSVQPTGEHEKTLEVVPLAVTSPDSWAETDLRTLENGEAHFDPAGDLQGPISVAAAVEGSLQPDAEEEDLLQESKLLKDKKKGRMVVIGDSDFMTNAYINLAGNFDFILSSLQWLAQDERFIAIRPRQPEFKPLLLNKGPRTLLLLICVVLLPLLALFLGGMCVLRRRQKTS